VTVLEDPIDLADGVYEGEVEWQGMIRQPVSAITAAAIPVKPPAHWFTNPNFSTLTPLTASADGRVAGHIASWRSDHIGMAGSVKAPHSKSGYAFFATGVLETAEGTMVNVGQITLSGGHAPLEASVSEAVAHYDNTDSAWCDVAIGEDRYGIWAAGALRPTIDDNQLRAIRASSVSGDWRPINGGLELVAVCAVNVPGFPIPRARVASGVPVALIAAGTAELVELALHQDTDALVAAVETSFDDRLRLLENVVLGNIADARESMTAAIDAVRETGPSDLGGDPTDPAHVEGEGTPEERLAALRARVHGTADAPLVAPPVNTSTAVADISSATQNTSIAPDALAAGADNAARREALRASVHGPQNWQDGMEIHLPIEQCRQSALRASLQARVHPEDTVLVARATASWDAKHRDTAAKRGVALPDGSFPIADKADLKKAIKAVGRANDPAKAKRHIKKRAKTLGAEGDLPDSW
jgi:hypothetical protein